jgi:hypothetical protein
LLLGAALLAVATPAPAIPAFARKYGLPCSACHEAWPMLNNFGQTFKDNGYQLGNDRDAPIYHEPSYWPIMFRVTPTWHRESNGRVPMDMTPGNGTSGLVEGTVTTSGFDSGAIDIVTAGTLSKNISFFVQPFIANSGAGWTQTWVRFDNLFKTSWLNVKMGKFGFLKSAPCCRTTPEGSTTTTSLPRPATRIFSLVSAAPSLALRCQGTPLMITPVTLLP